MAVGGGEGEIPALDLNQHAGQHRTSLVGGRGHLGLLHRPDQVVKRHLESVTFIRTRSRRELLRLDALDVGVESRAAQVERLRRRIERQLEVIVRKRAHKVGEQPRGCGRRAFRGDLGGDDFANANLEVGRGEGQAL